MGLCVGRGDEGKGSVTDKRRFGFGLASVLSWCIICDQCLTLSLCE